MRDSVNTEIQNIRYPLCSLKHLTLFCFYATFHNMENGTLNRPPNARGQGRKSINGSGNSPVLRVRVTESQLEKVDRLGGPGWIRKAIDSATDDQAVTSTAKTNVVNQAVNQALDKVGQKISKLIENARAKA